MSEEILKALTQLFAIITKQDDGVTENEREFVIRFFQQELDQDSVREYIELYDSYSGYREEEGDTDRSRLTSVKDSVRTLSICRKINKTLTQKQKVVVLIKLLELVGADKNFSAQRMDIITTVSTVFNIAPEEYALVEAFVVTEEAAVPDRANIYIYDERSAGNADMGDRCGNDCVLFLRVPSVDMYFVKHHGKHTTLMNGLAMQENRVYQFSHGSTIRLQDGNAIYYSDLIAHFNDEIRTTKLSFAALIKEFRFPNGVVGLQRVVVAEGPGKLIGIMGASGAGKTTLLNVLAGMEKGKDAIITINGFNIYTEREKVIGAIGYVPQDDLLIEELSVYQNLHFSAMLCFKHASQPELHERTLTVLQDLGLEAKKDLQVGNVLNKTISGGQRKRLNIALELIREPPVMFLDEPTSGLSSRDSENVIDLLKELSLKGKLIFVVIHQPSSDIYKMFDKMIIMDTGGYPVYYGNPVEAVTYFKKAAHQVDSNRGQCGTCGNVNPEQLFNIIEAKVVDEYGQPTAKRKVTPLQWHEMYATTFVPPKVEEIHEEPVWTLQIPGKLKQAGIFARRDLLSKFANRQYLLINLMQAPLLAAILAFVIKYRNTPDGAEYLLRFNDNLPAFILMSIVVALFMGLTVSAEEIIRDRKILKRESFLNLSWNSYLISKLSILFFLSGVQTFLFVLVSHWILEIHGMILPFWLVLFSTSCFANILGLNISSAFSTVVTVYIVIPLLLIPQMILSGTMFSFDKLSDYLSTKGKVPVIADLMASRWAYEALAVHTFVNNSYQREIYVYEREKANADFKSTYLADELTARVEYGLAHYSSEEDQVQRAVASKLSTVIKALEGEPFRAGIEDLELARIPGAFDEITGNRLLAFIVAYKKHYQQIFNENASLSDKKLYYIERQGVNVNGLKNRYFNESLSDLVRNIKTTDRIAEVNGELIQLIDPVYQNPKPVGIVDYRTIFFCGSKNLFGKVVGAFGFNVLVIWVMSLVLYVTLYTEALRKIINRVEGLNMVNLRT
jgi:ABC-type multidrug transport system ATPase subunit/ABC-type multidrug transport system permease subunit